MYDVHSSKEEPIDMDDLFATVHSSSGGRRMDPMLERKTPSDYNRRNRRGYDRSSNRGSPPSLAPTPGSVSSMGKSTPTAEQESENMIRELYKESPSRMRRPSKDLDQHFNDKRRSRDDLLRMKKSSNRPMVDRRSNSGKNRTVISNLGPGLLNFRPRHFYLLKRMIT